MLIKAFNVKTIMGIEQKTQMLHSAGPRFSDYTEQRKIVDILT